MKLTVEKGDIFDINDLEVYYAHCISADFALGAGIAVQFNKRYNMRHRLKLMYPNGPGYGSKSIVIDNVFNLVTKQRCYYKPTLESLTKAVKEMRTQCDELRVKKLVMPKIGCGLDRLNWEDVQAIIEKTFADSDIEIIVRFL